jgi:hypothetical protein
MIDPVSIIAAISAGRTVVSWIEGVIFRHSTGTNPTSDEVAILNVLGVQLKLARGENDDSDARLDAALGE